MSHSVLDDWKKKVRDANNNADRLTEERKQVYKSVQDMAGADAIKTDQAITRMLALDVLIRKQEKIVRMYSNKIDQAIATANRYK